MHIQSHMHEGVHIQLGNEWHVSFFIFVVCVCVRRCNNCIRQYVIQRVCTYYLYIILQKKK